MSVCVGISDEIEVATIATDEAAIALPFQLSLATLRLCNDVQKTRKKCAARSCSSSRFRRCCSCANPASSINTQNNMGEDLACVASVSNRVIARKLERKQKKVEGGGGGEKRKRLPANPTILENAP